MSDETNVNESEPESPESLPDPVLEADNSNIAEVIDQGVHEALAEDAPPVESEPARVAAVKVDMKVGNRENIARKQALKTAHLK